MRMQVTFAAIMVLAAPATAQQARQAAAAVPVNGPSVEGYVCQFTGKCDGGAARDDVTMNSGATKGFRMARAVPDKPAVIAVPAHPGYVGPRPVAHAAAPVPYGRHAPAHLVTPATPPAAAGAARPRADLLIGFERNSARISPEGIASARVFAQALMTPDLAGKRFLIEGHTDLRGGRQLNMALSAKRAEAVTDYLVSQGVDRSRLFSRGIGPDAPLPGHNPGDPTNRRVEAELLP